MDTISQNANDARTEITSSNLNSDDPFASLVVSGSEAQTATPAPSTTAAAAAGRGAGAAARRDKKRSRLTSLAESVLV